MAVAPKRAWTPEEYLTMEEQSEIRHEFVNGEIYAMSGATRNHNRITLNIAFGFRSALGKRPCEVFATDMRLFVKRSRAFFYPDVMVICGKVAYERERRDLVTNPTVIVEVLSASTSDYDHTRKFALYRKIPTLQEYAMIDQSRIYVECFRRTESKLGVYEAYEEPQDHLRLASVEIEIPLATIYEGVELEATT